ncbi:MAG: hypothetical protein ACSLEL_01560 [Candidatus Malihini olakiniferum]
MGISLFLLAYADCLVYGTAVLTCICGVSPLIVGVMIINIFMLLLELIVAFAAMLNQQIDMTVSNILGANIANILFILSNTALIYPLTFRSDLLRHEPPMLIDTAQIWLALQWLPQPT